MTAWPSQHQAQMPTTPRSQPARDRILEAARRLFATEGYERTTIRAVAAAAGIHPSMVMRYYVSKEALFAAAAHFDLGLPDLAQTPREEIGRTLVLHFLHRWGSEVQELPALLRMAATHPGAHQRLLEIFGSQLVPALAQVCGREEVQIRAALVATQMLGLAFTRFVLGLPAVAALAEEVIGRNVGDTVQRYLTGPLAGPATRRALPKRRPAK